MIKAGQKRRKKPKLKMWAAGKFSKRAFQHLQEDAQHAADYLAAQRSAFKSNKKKLAKDRIWKSLTWPAYLESKFISEYMNRRQSQHRNRELEAKLLKLQERLTKRKKAAKR